MIDERRVRLPPHAKLQVEEATTLLDQALAAGRSAMQLLMSNPAGAVPLAARQQDLMHQALRKLERACTGLPGVEEQRTKQTAGATNVDRLMGAHE